MKSLSIWIDIVQSYDGHLEQLIEDVAAKMFYAKQAALRLIRWYPNDVAAIGDIHPENKDFIYFIAIGSDYHRYPQGGIRQFRSFTDAKFEARLISERITAREQAKIKQGGK